MGAKIVIDKDILNKILADYESGMSIIKLSVKYNYTHGVIARHLKENNTHIRKNDYYSKKYSCNNKYFEKIDSEEKAYWLGFIYADGFLSQYKHGASAFGLSIHVDDIKHVENLKNCLEATYPINIYEVTGGYKIGSKYCRIMIKDQLFVDTLISKGIRYNKTGNLDFPTEEIVHKTLMSHFIRGYYDGNGSIRASQQKYKKYYKIGINGTGELLRGMMNYIPVYKEKIISKTS